MSASFDSYKIFYYVGKYKNITHAATALFLSQSTVSRCIQSLESTLGCKLFDRTQHGVAFTIEGEVLYNHISKACEQIFLGEEKVLQMQQMTRGGLRIGVSDFVFDYFLLPVLKDFHQEFPSIQLEIISMGFDSYSVALNSLLAGKIDIACSVAMSQDNMGGGAVEEIPVASYKDTVIAGSKFSELRTGSYYFYDLAAYPFISLASDSPNLSHLDRLFLSHGLSVSPEFKVDSINMFMPIVKRCQCLAIVPALLKDEFTDGDNIFEVKMKDELPTHNVSVITAKTAPQSAAREAFVKQLKKYIKSKVYGALDS